MKQILSTFCYLFQYLWYFVGHEQIASIIVMIGRAFVTSGGCVVVIMQEELHPTLVKQKIVGIENGISLAITIAGPYLTELVRFTIQIRGWSCGLILCFTHKDGICQFLDWLELILEFIHTSMQMLPFSHFSTWNMIFCSNIVSMGQFPFLVETTFIKINHNSDNNITTEKFSAVFADKSLGCPSHTDLRVLQYLRRDQLNVAARDGGNEDAWYHNRGRAPWKVRLIVTVHTKMHHKCLLPNFFLRRRGWGWG